MCLWSCVGGASSELVSRSICSFVEALLSVLSVLLASACCSGVLSLLLSCLCLLGAGCCLFSVLVVGGGCLSCVLFLHDDE